MRTIQSLQQLSLIIVVGLLTCPASVRGQTAWTPHASNPALTPGSDGDWDAGIVFLPTVIQSGDSLKMWYSGAVDGRVFSTLAIGYATSVDGINWIKHPANPVMTARPGEWDQPGVFNPSVMLDGDTLRMWYLGGNGPDQSAIGYATSLDGVNWDRHPAPVMDTGAAGTWNAQLIGPGTAIKEDGVFKMWFFGGIGGTLHAGNATKTGIGYATSPDGITWTPYDDPTTTDTRYQFSDPVLNHGESGAWDANETFTPSVVRTDAGYEMWYSGWRADGEQYIGYATSPDGINWTKDPENPIGTWSSELGYPSVILDDDVYRMWYTRWRVPTADIEYATSPVSVVDHVETVPVQNGIELHQNYPNPFAQETSIRYEVSTTAHVELSVYNLLGQRVRTLRDRVEPVGIYEVGFDGRSESGEVIPNGLYFYRLETRGIALTGRMMLLR